MPWGGRCLLRVTLILPYCRPGFIALLRKSVAERLKGFAYRSFGKHGALGRHGEVTGKEYVSQRVSASIFFMTGGTPWL